MEIFKFFLTIVGLAMSFGYYPQAYKIWKNKSSADISISTYITFSIGTVMYSIYAILINDFALFISFIFGVLGSWLVLALTIIYRKK